MRVPAAAEKVWAGIDVGERHDWGCVVGPGGRQLLPVKVANDQAEIEAVIGSVTGLGKKITWAVDIIGRHLPCCWPCSARPASMSVMHPDGSSRR